MATTFDVFYLGTGPALDPTEGNTTTENANAIVGNTYGSFGDPLVNHIQTLSPGSGGFSGGASSNAYDMNNSASNEKFTLDGGPDQTFDVMVIYNTTIIYTDGTTVTITATVFQDTAGRLYLAPENTDNSDQDALEAKPIASIKLNSVSSTPNNMFGDRSATNYAVCFTAGAAILTPQGERVIDDLRVGDLVTTMDNGPQPIRWIGRKHLDQRALLEKPELCPILIRKEVLGARRNLLVSPKHGMLLGRDHLVRAKHLVEVPKSGIRVAAGKKSVTYIHLMFDTHQIVFAEGTPSESFYPGPMAQRMVDPAARAELSTLFPDVFTQRADKGAVTRHYGETARAFLARKFIMPQFREGLRMHA